MSSSTASATSSATTSAASAALKVPGQFKIVGVILAVLSGLLIGSSFVFKKKGLIASQAGGAAGEGVGYLKSPMWWTGMSMMILGELCNFAAYAFVDAIVVTPLGALSVVICAILSSMFLNEKLTFFGWIGCFLCIVGSVIIALNGPQEQTVSEIREFQKLFLSLGFIIYGSLIILSALVIIFFVAPKWGKKTMLPYIVICSLFGGLSVSCTQGLGSSIVTSIRGNNQFTYWFTYFILVFVVCTLVTEIYYLNMALALFNTAMVTPTYYVIFTFFTLVTSVVLYQGLHATITQLITIVMGFLVICAGITILQMSKVDPASLKNLDRKSTILLQASRQTVEHSEKNDISGMEDPGMDALRGTFGAVGSIIRARSARQMSLSQGGSSIRTRHRRGMAEDDGSANGGSQQLSTRGMDDLPRHQLYDAPMPSSRGNPIAAAVSPRTQAITFEESDVAHYYPSPGKTGRAVHEERARPTFPPAPPNSSRTLDDITEQSTPRQAERPEFPESPVEDYTSYTSYDSYDDDPPSKRRPFRHQDQHQTRQTSDPFRDFGPEPSNRSLSQSEVDLLSTTPTRGSEEDVAYGYNSSNPPPSHGRTSSGRRYPGGGRSSSEDEEDREARSSLVDQAATKENRGGIRLLPAVPRSRV